MHSFRAVRIGMHAGKRRDRISIRSRLPYNNVTAVHRIDTIFGGFFFMRLYTQKLIGIRRDPV